MCARFEKSTKMGANWRPIVVKVMAKGDGREVGFKMAAVFQDS